MMRKLLFIIPFILSVFCLTPTYAELSCPPDGGPGCRRPGGGGAVGKCDGLRNHQECTDRIDKTRKKVTYAECQPINRQGTLSCTTLCCTKPYYLKFGDNGNSLGFCVTREEAVNDCKKCTTHNCVPVLEEDAVYSKYPDCKQNLFKGCVPGNSTPVPAPEEPKGCKLEFTELGPVENVDIAYSYRKGTESLSNEEADNLGISIASIYIDPDDENIIQNYIPADTKYNKDGTPHLVNLTKINNRDISEFVTNVQDLRNAGIVNFNCNKGNPEIEIIPMPETHEQPAEEEIPKDCELGFSKGDPTKISEVYSARSTKIDTGDTNSYYLKDGNIVIYQNYEAFDGPITTNIPTLFDLETINGVNIPDAYKTQLATGIRAIFSCNNGSYTLEITQPAPEEPVTEPEKGCTLYFGDKTISGIYVAETAKKIYTDRYDIITQGKDKPDIATYYANNDSISVKQNINSKVTDGSYDANILHLFDLTKIKLNDREYTLAQLNINPQDLQEADYVKCACDNTPSITLYKIPPKPQKITPIGGTCNVNGCFDPSAFTQMNLMLNNYFDDSSYWKNDEGTFNTTRLIADSAAGVVLGTVGGVVTSQIVKKNQLKTGFEKIKCTVGGQDVANFNDEFWVGITD